MSEHAHDHVVPKATYVKVLIALMVLLVFTLAASFIDLDKFMEPMGLGRGWNTALALTIALVKALLIVLIFMHVKFSSKLTMAFAGMAFVWLGIMLVLTMTDYASRKHPAGVNPKGEPEFLSTPEQSGTREHTASAAN